MISAQTIALLGLSFGLSVTSVKIADMEQGAKFDKCISVTDFTTKTVNDEVELKDRDANGCCEANYAPGVKHYSKYVGAQIICGFLSDGSKAADTSASTSNGVRTCTYNNCYIMKTGVTCKDGTPMKLNGCCGADNKNTNYNDDCKMYNYKYSDGVVDADAKSLSVPYCLSYHKNYKMEGTKENTDDQVDGMLVVNKLYVYTPCTGGTGGTGGTASTGGGTSPSPSPAAAGGASSCNVGAKTAYSGSCAASAEMDTFKETSCGSQGFKCLTLQYNAEAGGCTAASSVGYCASSAATCAYYDKTYKDNAAYAGYECTECETNNCNTMDTKGGDGGSTASDAMRTAAGMASVFVAVGIWV